MRFGFCLLALSALMVAACDLQNQPAAPTPTPTISLPTLTPTTTAVQLTATATSLIVPEGQFVNPVLQSDFPDPGIIKVDGVYHAYATNSSNRNVQHATSADLVNWKLQPDALPALPSWADLGFGNVWAPEVIGIGDRYVMYYTARDKASNRQCIGVATSDKPEGKFTDANDKPFICQVEGGGSIDASPFRDGDKLYLYWKNDGNCCGGLTYIYVQELAPDGLSLHPLSQRVGIKVRCDQPS